MIKIMNKTIFSSQDVIKLLLSFPCSRTGGWFVLDFSPFIEAMFEILAAGTFSLAS